MEESGQQPHLDIESKQALLVSSRECVKCSLSDQFANLLATFRKSLGTTLVRLCPEIRHPQENPIEESRQNRSDDVAIVCLGLSFSPNRRAVRFPLVALLFAEELDLGRGITRPFSRR